MQGKILKIKTGYNPNSSSIGVDMVVFFTAGAAMTVLFNTLAAVLCASQAREHGKPEKLEDPSMPSQSEEHQ